MPKIGHIYIFGDIYHDNSTSAEEWGVISAKGVLAQLEAVKDSDELEIHINSRGGDVVEGFAIHDILVATGKPLTTIVEGLCASIATIILLAAPKRKSFANSETMIHNPWGMTGGTAEEVQRYADQLKKYEEKILDFYVEKTGASREIIKDKMDSETFLTADEALELKFITEIVDQVKAFAKLNFNTKMKKQTTLVESVKARLKALIEGKQPVASALMLKAGDDELEIVTASDKPTIGDEVKINGEAAPAKNYILPDGTEITVADGKISAIVIPDPADSGSEAALKAENETLKTDLAQAKKDLVAAQAKFTAKEKEFNVLKNELVEINAIVAQIQTEATPPSREGKEFIVSRKEEAVESDALARMKQLKEAAAKKTEGKK